MGDLNNDCNRKNANVRGEAVCVCVGGGGVEGTVKGQMGGGALGLWPQLLHIS